MIMTNSVTAPLSSLIRVRIYQFDYDGTRSQRSYVTYVEAIEEAEKMGWKYELA